MYLLWDPAVFPHGAALLVQEGVEVCCLDAAATPVLVPKQQQKRKYKEMVTVCKKQAVSSWRQQQPYVIPMK